MTPYRQGIEDYAAGRSFSPAYDRWPSEAQQSYERGRLKEAQAKMKRRALPRRFTNPRNGQVKRIAADDARPASQGQRR